MKNLTNKVKSAVKKGYSFTELSVWILVIITITIISFAVYGSFSNTANSTSSVASLMRNMSDETEVVKLKIDKRNVVAVAQVWLNTTTAQAKAIEFYGDPKLVDWVEWEKGDILVAYEAGDLANGTNQVGVDATKFTEGDLSAPKIFIYATKKLSQDVQWVVYLGTGTLTGKIPAVFPAMWFTTLPPVAVHVYQHKVTAN